MTDGQNFVYQTLQNDLRIYDNIQKNATAEGVDYKTGYLLNYNCFMKYCKMIAIDLIKQQALDDDPKVMQQTNFTGNLRNEATVFFIIKKVKEINLDFSQETLKVL